MELLIMLVIPFPLGYFVRQRLVAFMVYIAAHSFVFSFQSLALVRLWVGGDYAAFPKNPEEAPWAYGLVNLAIYSVGLGLVALGSRVGSKRRAKAAAGVDLVPEMS